MADGWMAFRSFGRSGFEGEISRSRKTGHRSNVAPFFSRLISADKESDLGLEKGQTHGENHLFSLAREVFKMGADFRILI